MNFSFLRYETTKLMPQKITVKKFQIKLAASYSIIVHCYSIMKNTGAFNQ